MNTTTAGGYIREHLDVDNGGALLIFASQYQNLTKVVCEMVQNILDAESRNCKVLIDLRARTLIVMDDGNGSSRERMRNALQEIAHSQKADDKPYGQAATGQFGIGICAPLDKVSRQAGSYSIITGPVANRNRPGWEGMHEWCFDDIIRGKGTQPTSRRRYNLPNDPTETRRPQWWSTWVEVRHLVDDRRMRFNRDELLRALQRFGALLDQVEIKLYVTDKDGRRQEPITVERDRFHGQPIEIASVSHPKCGTVRFELYFRETATKPNLFVKGGSAQQWVPWDRIVKTIEEGLGELDPYTRSALTTLNSGHFEGVIHIDKCRLHPNRESFECDDALVEGLLLLAKWAEECGRAMLDEVRFATVNERRENTLAAVLDKLKEAIRSQPAKFEDALTSFSGVAVSSGHATIPGMSETGRSSIPTSRDRKPVKNERRKAQSPSAPQHDPTRVHISIVRTDGSTRRISPGDKGLRFSLEDIDDPWPFVIDEPNQKVIINQSHPLFGQVEAVKSKANSPENLPLGQYYRAIIQIALALLQMPHDDLTIGYQLSRYQLECWMAMTFPNKQAE